MSQPVPDPALSPAVEQAVESVLMGAGAEIAHRCPEAREDAAEVLAATTIAVTRAVHRGLGWPKPARPRHLSVVPAAGGHSA